MPIRFRCAYCNQLMGIARRKAGTVVSCPNCSGQVVVPVEDAVETTDPSSPTAAPRDASQPLFERGDFDELFRSGKGLIPAPAAPPPKPPPPAAGLMPAPPPAPKQTGPVAPLQQPMMPPPRLDLPAPSPPVNGYVISSSMATLLTVALVVALALAFTAGLLVGRFYLQPSDEAKPSLEGRYNAERTPRV